MRPNADVYTLPGIESELMIKSLLRDVAANLPVGRLEQLYSHALHKQHFREQFAGTNSFTLRVDLWSDLSARIGQVRILYLEFGVFAGESMRFWCGLNSNPGSAFYGFDTFEGLPEAWAGFDRGHFTLDGEKPHIGDDRCTLVKGLFQDTVDAAFAAIDFKAFDQIVVHFDADLFSSTIFALAKVLERARSFYAIFDEFSGDESRAYFAMESAFNLTTEWYARIEDQGRPQQVSGRINR